MEIARPGVRRGMRVKPLLRGLGLALNARWEAVAPVLKRRLVDARRREDERLAAEWSEIAAFLKRNLKRTCGCGAGVKGRHCIMCGKPGESLRGKKRK